MPLNNFKNLGTIKMDNYVLVLIFIYYTSSMGSIVHPADSFSTVRNL